jgi:hypothetical protein
MCKIAYRRTFRRRASRLDLSTAGDLGKVTKKGVARPATPLFGIDEHLKLT